MDIQRQEPESLRKWREEQKTRLEALGRVTSICNVQHVNSLVYVGWFYGDSLLVLCSRTQKQDSASKAAEAEWREKAKKELEDWHVHQNEAMEKNKANNRWDVDMSHFVMQRSYFLFFNTEVIVAHFCNGVL